MALLPARRNGTLSRPGPQAPARWEPFAGFEDLYQRMGQLMSGAFDGGWQPLGQSWAPLADLSETGDAYLAEAGLPGVPGTTSASSSPARNWSSAASSRIPALTGTAGAAPRAALGPVRVPGAAARPGRGGQGHRGPGRRGADGHRAQVRGRQAAPDPGHRRLTGPSGRARRRPLPVRPARRLRPAWQR